jgi:hypothetical protein
MGENDHVATHGEARLRAFAAGRNLRVRRCLEVYLDPAEPATLALSSQVDGRQCRVVASAAHVALTVKAEVPVFFSVGSPHPALITNAPLSATHRDTGLDVFVSQGFQDVVARWLSFEKHLKAVKSLNLRPGESLHVARNESMLIVLADVDIDRALQNLMRFIEAAVDPEAVVRRTGRLLPTQFADLENVARDWATSDDVERTERVDALHVGTRQELMDKIQPRLADIDRYLDERAQSRLSAADQRLQSIGELGAELRRRQNERPSSS